MIRPQRALEPHPELWDRLQRGPLLRRILEHFYDLVYDDPRLKPFFERTTKTWAIDHQYAFLGQIFSGEKMFFGDRPRNAHHWMVIDDALFDYREELMMSVLAEHGLSQAERDEWRSVEECFRKHIVKDTPRPLVRGGRRQALDGVERLVLSAGGWCDECSSVLEKDVEVEVHVRTGHVRCDACASSTSTEAGTP